MAKGKHRPRAGTKRDPGLHTPPGIPPGASHKAWEREENLGGGPPGSGAGERHAANTPEDALEAGLNDDANVGDGALPSDAYGEPQAEEDIAYAGHAGGAVGGTPANRRAKGGTIRGGIDP